MTYQMMLADVLSRASIVIYQKKTKYLELQKHKYSIFNHQN